MFDLSLQEPVGPPTPKRPRGRPKGSKNKGPRTALKVETDQNIQNIKYSFEFNCRIVTAPCFWTILQQSTFWTLRIFVKSQEVLWIYCIVTLEDMIRKNWSSVNLDVSVVSDLSRSDLDLYHSRKKKSQTTYLSHCSIDGSTIYIYVYKILYMILLGLSLQCTCFRHISVVPGKKS